MKKLLLTFALVISANVAMAQDEAYKKDVMKVIEMSGSGAQMEMVKKQILQAIPADKQAAFLIEFNASLPALYDKLVKVYSETYTKEDIKAMIAFYDSPVGKKMAEKTEELMEKSQAAGAEWGQGLQAMMMKYMQ